MKKNRIIIASATEGEIAGARNLIRSDRVEFLITGVGMIATALRLYEFLHGQNNMQCVIQAGIGGSFTRNMAIGTVVNVTQDAYGDLGVETASSFKTLAEAGWDKVTVYSSTFSHAAFSSLQEVTAITVAMACGSEKTAALRREKFNPVIETMEGAAFFQVCNHLNIPCAQIRAVSNYCGLHRDGEWNSALASANLCSELARIISNITYDI